MITLDYTTYNPRWKHSGIRYSSWEAFAFALGIWQIGCIIGI